MNNFTNTLGVIKYTGTPSRVFTVNVSLSAFLASGSNNDVEFALFKNGTIITNTIFGWNLGSGGGNPKTGANTSFVDLVTNDELEIRIRNRTDTISITGKYVSLTCI